MATPLEWLGGAEKDDVLSMLAGTWRDERGSTYQLFEGRGSSLDVLTSRPSGERIYTKALIRNHGGGTLWGSADKAFILHMGGDRLQWKRGKQHFTWHKLQ